MTKLANDNGFRFSRKWVGAIALGAMISLISACEGIAPTDQAGQETPGTGQDSAQVEEGAPIEGELVTLRSTVNEVLDNNGFVMESEDGSAVLVINPTGVPFVPPEDDMPVQVTGQLETFDAATIQQQYGIELDPGIYNQYSQEPVVVAQNFALAPTPQELWDEPTSYFEQAIAIEGEPRLLEEGTTGAFALYDEGWVDDVGILVVGNQQLVDSATLEDDERVVVTGEARPIDEQILRDANLNLTDAQIQNFLERYENRPVIIAEEVYRGADAPIPSL
jgi:hypothetical protein